VGALLAAITAVVAVLLASAWYTCGFRGCPNVAKLRGYIPQQASVVLDRRGSEIGKLYRVNRRIVPLDSLPRYVPEAFVAVEDKRFYHHHGVDWQRVPGAVLADLRHHGFAQGFSTITMQLARNLFPNRLPAAEKSPLRKLAEMRVAMRIEDRYSKQDILQMYLNQIYFGHGAWGIDAAAEEYFGKPASTLTVAEAATLAGLPQSPSTMNPRTDRKAATERRNVVLADMARQGFITPAQAETAQRTRIRLRRGESAGLQQEAPYFLKEVRTLLEAQLGDAIYTQGLVIHTTLDLPTQKVAEAELERQLETIEHGGYGAFHHPRYDPRLSAGADSAESGPAYLQGALMMLDSRTGDVLAYVGGRNFAQSRFDRVTQARRQPGSAFKPFVYTAAVEAGYPPSYTVLDEPLVVPVGRGRVWTPRNYEGDFRGPIPMADALAESRNVPTVRLASQVGLERVIDTAHEMGINESIPFVPSMPLGVVSVTPWELIDAYTAFSSLGNKVQPRLVTSVEDRDGNVVWGEPPQAQQTLDPAVAFVMTSMLKDVVDRGTGMPVRAAGFHGPAAGKTGTTQGGTDAWFIGFTPRLTMGIWIGFDRPTPIGGGATGGALAGPVWGRIMARTAAPGADWAPPPGVDKLWVVGNGAVLAANCPAPPGAVPMWFVSGTEPQTGDCSGPGSYAQAAPVDTAAIDTTSVPGAAPQDQGWWNRLRSRIFGGADSTAAAGVPAAPGTPGVPGAGAGAAPAPPSRRAALPPGEPREPIAPAPPDTTEPVPPRGRPPAHRLPRSPAPGDSLPPGRAKPAPPAQPPPPPPAPPDTSGG